MTQLLSLLAAIALLVWATHFVRAAVLQMFGTRLRHLLARGAGNTGSALLAGLGATAALQSSTATALIVSGFVGQGLLGLPVALAAMLGADVGTSLMAALLSLDLSWVSPLFILSGVMLSVARKDRPEGRAGAIFVGLGLLLLALKLITAATTGLTHAPALRGLLAALQGDLLLSVTLGAVLTIAAYSSLAMVLLTATLAAGGSLGVPSALALVLGANLGSGLLAVLTTARADAQTRQLPLGNLLFKVAGVSLTLPAMRWLTPLLDGAYEPATLVIGFHLSFNLCVAVLFVGFTRHMAAVVERCLPLPPPQPGALAARVSHLDPAALATPSLAMSCAARELMHQADVVETMLAGLLSIIQRDDLTLAARLRQMDDTVDALCSSIKRYLTQLPRSALQPADGQRWSRIVEFSIALEQVADIVERILQDVEEKNIRQGQRFSAEGQAEICELHGRLVHNLRLATSVFLNCDPRDARRLLDEKARFRALERSYAETHLARLARKQPESIQTSGQHMDLLAELRRINSHLCAIGYPVLEAAA